MSATKLPTVYKRVEDLQADDQIVTRNGHAVFVRRVSDVRFVTDGKVHVDLDYWTTTSIYDEGETVQVIKSQH